MDLPEEFKGIPTILETENKEKFRRRLLISTRIIAIFLILAMVYWGWIYYNYGKILKNDPCWACGYYKGKECKQLYFHDPYISPKEKEEILLGIAERNDIDEPLIKEVRNPSLNLSFIESLNINSSNQ